MRLAIILFFILKLSVFIHAQKRTQYIVEPDTAGKIITYGSEVEMHYYKIDNNEVREEIEYKSIERQLILSADNGQINSDGNLAFPFMSSNSKHVVATINITPKVSTIALLPQIKIKMNYRSDLKIDFSGKNGDNGSSGTRGVLGLNYIDDGEAGNDGDIGKDAKDIYVLVKKEFDSILFKDVYVFKVRELKTANEYYYRCVYPEKGIFISSNGGNGGKGGYGENGRDKTEDRDAENGGDGGNGGRGGKGGRIVIHSNASEIIPYIKTSNQGGIGGEAGVGGVGGSEERDISNAVTKKYSFDGHNGLVGQNGVTGPLVEVKVAEFTTMLVQVDTIPSTIDTIDIKLGQVRDTTKSSGEVGVDSFPKIAPKTYYVFNTRMQYKIFASVGIGPETGLSFIAPKLSFYIHDPWFNAFYAGVDVNIWGTFFYSNSFGATFGVHYKFLRLENSISKTFFNEEASGAYQWTSCNPKVGIYYKMVGIKFGPSFILDKENRNEPLPDFIPNWNLEVSIDLAKLL